MFFFRKLLHAFLLLELVSVFTPEALAENTTARNAARNGIATEVINAPRILKERNDRDPTPPETDQITVKGTVEELFGKFYFSQQVPLKSKQFEVGEDPIKAELELMDRWIARVKSEEIPAKEAHLILTRYHLADDRVFERLKKAAELGMNVDVITDLNDSVTVTGWKKGEEALSDFTDERIKPNNSPNGRMYKKLLDAGFEPGTAKKKPRLGIYSQQIFNKKAAQDKAGDGLVMFDLMHEKSVVGARIKNGKVVEAEATAGSANMVAHGALAKLTGDKDIVTRVNIVREIKAQPLVQRRYEHALNLIETFTKSGNISDMAKENFFRVNAKNGWVETGFTNGKYNLNDRIAALVLHGVPGMTKELVAKGFDKGVESFYERLAPEFKGLKIKEIRESQFVWTHSQGREAEKLLFDYDPDVIKKGKYDAKFNTVDGWGFPAVQSAGVSLLRKMGGTIFPWKKDIADRVDSQIYLRGLPGVPETDLNGPPLSRFLLHLKLWMMKGLMPDGREVTIIFDGSLNRSNHKENAEDQDMIVIYGKSELAESYWALPELLGKVEAEYFSSAFEELMTDTFARFTGKSPVEVPHDFAPRVGKFIALGKIDEAADELEKLSKVKTELEEKPDPKVVKDRLEKFRAFMHWHKKNFKWMYGKPENFYLHRLLEVATIMFNNDIDNHQAGYALKGIMYAQDYDDAKEIELAKEAWVIIGRDLKDFPDIKPKDDAAKTHDNRGEITKPELGLHRENQRSIRAAPPRPGAGAESTETGASAADINCKTAARGVSGKKSPARRSSPGRTSGLPERWFKVA